VRQLLLGISIALLAQGCASLDVATIRTACWPRYKLSQGSANLVCRHTFGVGLADQYQARDAQSIKQLSFKQ
jgi:hypothetical protein